MINKICTKCKTTFSSDSLEGLNRFFYKGTANKDGLAYFCKKCAGLREASPERGSIRMRESHPQKYRARYLTNNALAKGRLKKMPCQTCGESRVQAHHEDYSKPLEIIWLCIPCHRAVHLKQVSHA